MKTINSKLVPWLIAREAYNLADRNNIDVASEMITKIIIAKELNGYTIRPPLLPWKGETVKQNNFTNHVLLTIGTRHFSCWSSLINFA